MLLRARTRSMRTIPYGPQPAHSSRLRPARTPKPHKKNPPRMSRGGQCQNRRRERVSSSRCRPPVATAPSRTRRASSAETGLSADHSAPTSYGTRRPKPARREPLRSRIPIPFSQAWSASEPPSPPPDSVSLAPAWIGARDQAAPGALGSRNLDKLVGPAPGPTWRFTCAKRSWPHA